MSYLNTNFRYISAYSGDYNVLLYRPQINFLYFPVYSLTAPTKTMGNQISILSFNVE